MEDTHAIKFVKKDSRDYEFAYFGIFDGHGGPEASRFARDHLLDEITKYEQFWSDNDDDVLFAIKSGFLDTHHAMWKELGKISHATAESDFFVCCCCCEVERFPRCFGRAPR